MNEPSWREAQQRSASPPSAHPERQERAADAEDTFAGLYRAPARGATSQAAARRPAARTGGPRGPGEADGGPEHRRSHGWGQLPARSGVLIVTMAAGLGVLGTIITASEPGRLLGVALIAGAVAGVLAVRPKAAYRLVPVPALAGFAAALLAGAVHDRAVDNSHTEVALNALGWLSGGFAAMAAATGITLVIAVARLAWHARRGRASDDAFADVPGGGRPGG